MSNTINAAYLPIHPLVFNSPNKTKKKKYMRIFLNSHIDWIPSQLNITLAYCLLSNNVHDYRIVSQGKTTIPSVDDGAEFEDTDVRIGRANFRFY